MASWHPRLLAVLSWAFPILMLAMGLYAAADATTGLIPMIIASAALAVASLVDVATSNPGNRFTTGLAVAAAIPFVFSGDDGVDLAGTVAAYGVGLAGVWVLRYSRGENHNTLLPTLVD